MNRGDAWREISPDLTTNDPAKLKGNIEFCTLTSISESPVTPGVIWTGSDDGKVQVTRNGGGTWTDATAKLAAAGGPADYYVTRVFASPHKEGTAFVTKAGWHRDVYAPFVFRTDDFGESWTAIGKGLPDGTVYVVVQDRKNADLLFVGTEMGVFVTFDGGKAVAAVRNGPAPYALVHDLLIHPRENDLVVATHGRGLFTTDITPLQEATAKIWDEDVHLFAVEPKIQWPRRSVGFTIGGERQFVGAQRTGRPGDQLPAEERRGRAGQGASDGSVRRGGGVVQDGSGKAGLQSVVWDFRRTGGTPAAGGAQPPAGQRGRRPDGRPSGRLRGGAGGRRQEAHGAGDGSARAGAGLTPTSSAASSPSTSTSRRLPNSIVPDIVSPSTLPA